MKKSSFKNKKKQQGAFHKNLETMTYNKIMQMQILESEQKIRFLFDGRNSKFYVIFDGRTNQSYYAKSHAQAQRFYNRLVASC
jgi:translation initiation factor IF-3